MNPYDAELSPMPPMAAETARSASLFSQLRHFNPLAFFPSATTTTTQSTSAFSPLLHEDPMASNCTPLAPQTHVHDLVPTPTPTRPSTPRPNRLPTVKSIITSISSRASRAQKPVHIEVQRQLQTEEDLLDENASMLTPTVVSECVAMWGGRTATMRDDSSMSSFDDTPPLTPESPDAGSLSPSSRDMEMGYESCAEEEDDFAFVRPHSQEIKEGKKPARTIDYDTLLDNISPATQEEPSATKTTAEADDAEEWYGLEYTLELSTRERRASKTPTIASGEHSKSRESWLALHQGTVHPFYENEEFSHWQNWHRYLDRLDEKRRHRRGRAFRNHAKDMAWVYADEMYTRDCIVYQEEARGWADRYLFDRLEWLEHQRQDSYHPPHKHNRAWHLKRSRSVSALRELCPPSPIVCYSSFCEV